MNKVDRGINETFSVQMQKGKIEEMAKIILVE